MKIKLRKQKNDMRNYTSAEAYNNTIESTLLFIFLWRNFFVIRSH